MWYPFLPPAHSGPMDVAQTGAYFAWISSQWPDGQWEPCLNPQALIVYSGTPHTPSGAWTEDKGGGVWRLHWNPEIYGTWLVQIAVYENDVGWIAPLDGPSSAYPQFSPWTFLDYGGLGIFVDSSGGALRFSHDGRDEGFDALLVAFARSGQGAAIMINANDNSRFMGRLAEYIARGWSWPMKAPAGPPAATGGMPVAAPLLAQYAGYYEAEENQMIALGPDAQGDGLERLVDGLPDETFLAIDSTRFGSSERPVRFGVARDGSGEVGALVWTSADGRERRMPRIAPLPSGVAPVADPDPALAGRIGAALAALGQGGSALAVARDVTPGAKQDFGAGIGSALDRSGPLTYIGETDVTGRGLHRHGSDVARVRYYRMPSSAGDRYLFVHLTAEGLVTDFDVVDR